MIDVYTAQYRYSEDDRLDITVKGEDSVGWIFAPTWDMVNDYRYSNKKQADEDKYVEAYRELLNTRTGEINQFLIAVVELNPESITFVCFCPPGAFCHRVILARDVFKGVFNYRGER